MSAKFFLDTNVLIYSFDKRSPAKCKKAIELIGEAVEDHHGIISYQVVQEFISAASRKFATPLRPDDLNAYVRTILLPLCEVHSSSELFRRALDVSEQTGFSFYDCLIVASALEAGCSTLYSEDLQSGRIFNGLRIVNPF